MGLPCSPLALVGVMKASSPSIRMLYGRWSLQSLQSPTPEPISAPVATTQIPVFFVGGTLMVFDLAGATEPMEGEKEQQARRRGEYQIVIHTPR